MPAVPRYAGNVNFFPLESHEIITLRARAYGRQPGQTKPGRVSGPEYRYDESADTVVPHV